KLGLRVIVARNDVSPMPVSHALLFKPVPFRNEVAATVPTVVPTTVGTYDKMRLAGPQPANPPVEYVNRVAGLQAVIAAKTAEADAIEPKLNAARLAVKQLSADKARAAKALRVAETTAKRAEAQLADADKDLANAKSPKATEQAQQDQAKAKARLTEAQT